MPLDPFRDKQLRQLIQKLGLPDEAPVQWELLDLALTHPTASAEENYERLEFVGDAVVRLVSAEFLFTTYPDADEGELAAIRSALVSDRILAQIADRYGLDRYLVLGSSVQESQAGKETRLAEALEALLAALYLSTHTVELVSPWLVAHLQDMSEIIRSDPTLQNYKGALQAWTQARYQILPEYRVAEAGYGYGDQERFIAEVWFLGQQWGQGKGRSKKAAEQAAAKEAFQVLHRES